MDLLKQERERKRKELAEKLGDKKVSTLRYTSLFLTNKLVDFCAFRVKNILKGPSWNALK